MACAALLRSEPAPFVVSPLVLAEACYLIGKFGSADNEATLLRAMARHPFQLEALSAADLERMAELVAQYGDLRLGGTVLPSHQRWRKARPYRRRSHVGAALVGEGLPDDLLVALSSV